MKKNQQKKFENRRLKGFRLLKKGMKQSDVARQLGVTRQTVNAWKIELDKNPTGWKAKPLGRPAFSTSNDLRKAASVLRRGLNSIGYRHEPWNLKLAREILGLYGRCWCSEAHASKILRSMGFSCKKPPYSDQKQFKRWEKYGWYPTTPKSIMPKKITNLN